MNTPSSAEKREALFQRWLNPKDGAGNDLQFKSPEAKKAYEERILRIRAAIELRKPDRVPVIIMPSFFPYYNAGVSPQEAMYDYDKLGAAFKKFIYDFDPDSHIGATAPGPGRMYDILDYKLYSWPGHGIAPEHVYQCNEDEYMKADEYDALIQDPTGYFLNKYLPRICGALQPLAMLPFFPGMLEMYGLAYNFIPFAIPPVQAALKALMDAGTEALNWAIATGGIEAELAAAGYPQLLGGFTKAPFDVIGDTLRGTKGIMLDVFRRPKKLIEAMEALTPLMIKMGVGAAQQTGHPVIFMPLHKGADGFLSDEQYKKFYWPTLRAVMVGLIEEGCIPLPAAEGGYGSRLEVIRDLPKASTLWMIDQTDMVKAKQALDGIACVVGNVPMDMLKMSTPEQVRQYADDLIKNAN
ncbi:MAG TPA: uroporphyrinogen decarboxylase family protein, partial [Anaerolineales bacterium]|nr:uroporphyrinogen decarboxylase family protein [Anaerolineales bacterium]